MKHQILSLVAVGGAAVGLAWGGSAPFHKGSELPQVVKDAVHRAHPNATIKDSEREHAKLTVYEIDVVEDGASFELKVADDGTIVEVEREVGWNDLPAAVQETIAKAAGSAQVREIERTDRHARPGFVPVTPADAYFEAEWKRDGHEIEIVVDTDGSLIGGDDGGDDDDHESDELEEDED